MDVLNSVGMGISAAVNWKEEIKRLNHQGHEDSRRKSKSEAIGPDASFRLNAAALHWLVESGHPAIG
jgi:hypothetical protein